MIESADYIPDAGDLIWVDFVQRVGGEQAGRRPVLVISPSALYHASHFAIICPITSRVRPFASSVILPHDLEIKGEILTSHVRSIDMAARPFAFTGIRIAPQTLAEVRAKLGLLMGM